MNCSVGGLKAIFRNSLPSFLTYLVVGRDIGAAKSELHSGAGSGRSKIEIPYDRKRINGKHMS
jgi:hypothetical protein